MISAVESHIGRKYYKHELPSILLRNLRDRLSDQSTPSQRRRLLPSSLSNFVRTVEEVCYGSSDPPTHALQKSREASTNGCAVSKPT